MAKPNKPKISSSPLQAITAAALVLPGMMLGPAHAAGDDEVDFQYSHYQEGERNLFGNVSKFSPIEVESLQGSAKFKLTDRIKFAFNYIQDTWGGATPIATAPEAFGGNGHYTGILLNNDKQSIKSGASPFLLGRSDVKLDQQLHPVLFDSVTNTFKKNDRLVHTLSEASPETRKQGDFKMGYEWDEAALDIGGGISIEDDYESRFGNINGRLDFNNKLTTVNLGLSYTNSDTNAKVDHDAFPYIYDIANVPGVGPEFYNSTHSSSRMEFEPDQYGFATNGYTLTGKREDWGMQLGLTQVLSKSALLEAGLGYTRSTGYMDNPYKAVTVAFIDPLLQDPSTACPEAALGLQCIDARAILENRPDVRNQWNGNLRYVQHIDALDAALHVGYRIFTDDWGITSHTFETDWVQPLGRGWTVTPRVRYYSQDAADFYTPYLVTKQGATPNIIDPIKGQAYSDGSGDGQLYYDDLTGSIPPPLDSDGNPIVNPNTGYVVLDANGNVVDDPDIVNALGAATKTLDRGKLPTNFSSDHRLSGYGALSGGVTVSKQFAKGVALDLGFEYYTHQGSLKIGGGGEGNFADFDYWLANATLKVNLDTFSLRGGSGHNAHSRHVHVGHAPAGVMFDHMLPKAGDMMAGYRYMYGSQGVTMLNGAGSVGDKAVVAGGCGPNPCFLTPDNMSMHMHMLDLMYAPTDWLTLMLMPQFVDMDMSMQGLDGAPSDFEANNNVGNPVDANGSPLNIGAHIAHHEQNGHETGGIGDLGMYALFKLFDNETHHAHVAAGLSAPTGDVDIQLRRNHAVDGGFIHYGMQLGSGTWDFKPSLTYTGHTGQWNWGAQANATVRMEEKNESGYRLGDLFQATAWGGYNLTDWLTASVRGVYSLQGAVKGKFNGLINQFGPMDYPENYGGKYWDVGFGLSAVVPSGDLAGNRISVEWLQPVEDNVNGYQLERDGSLSATWSVAF